MMGGGPGGGMGGDPGMATPPGGNPMAGPALSALDQLQPKGANPTAAIKKMNEACDLAYQLISTVISQAQMMNPKVAKDGHQIARGILNMKSEISKDSMPGPAPDLMMGMGAAGQPSPMGPGSTPGGGLGGPGTT
jgi:hypothetical protein